MEEIMNHRIEFMLALILGFIIMFVMILYSPIVIIRNFINFKKFNFLKNIHEKKSFIKLICISSRGKNGEYGEIYNKNFYDSYGHTTGRDSNLIYKSYTRDMYHYIKKIELTTKKYGKFYLLCDIVPPSDNIYLIDNIYRNYNNYIIKEIYFEVII